MTLFIGPLQGGLEREVEMQVVAVFRELSRMCSGASTMPSESTKASLS